MPHPQDRAAWPTENLAVIATILVQSLELPFHINPKYAQTIRGAIYVLRRWLLSRVCISFRGGLPRCA